MAVLANGEFVRPPIFGNDWTTIRIGLRGHLVGMAANLADPLLAFGVCSGSTNPFGAASSTNVVGIKFNGTTDLTYNANSGTPYANAGSTFIKPFKRVAATLTEGTTLSQPTHFGISTADRRTGIFLEITKGSPNYTIGAGGWSNSATYADLTDAEFTTIMDLPSLSTISSEKTNYSFGTTTLAADESAGDLDHIFVFWNRTVVPYSFDIKFRKVA